MPSHNSLYISLTTDRNENIMWLSRLWHGSRYTRIPGNDTEEGESGGYKRGDSWNGRSGSDASLEVEFPLWRQTSRPPLVGRVFARSKIAIIYAITNMLYISSLRGAKDPVEMNGYLGMLGMLLVLSVAFFSLQFWVVFFACHRDAAFYSTSNLPRFCILANAALQACTMLAWYIADGGNRLESHGAYNLLIFTIILLPSNLLIAILYFWYRLAAGSANPQRAKRFWIQLIAVGGTLALVVCVVACEKERALKYGFFGREIRDFMGKEDRQLQRLCQWVPAVPWFDLLPMRANFFTGDMTCFSEEPFSAAFKDDLLVIEGCDVPITEVRSYFNGSVIYDFQGPAYSFLPQTAVWGVSLKYDNLKKEYNNFQTNVLEYAEKHTFPYQGPTSIESSIGAVLAWCGNAEPRIAYRIVPGSSKSGSKPKLTQVPEDGLNVVTIFLDAVSRAQFHRRMPLTKRILEETTADPSSTSVLYEFFRYHTIGLNTPPNTRALWAGLSTSEPYATTDPIGPPLWEQFEDIGYASARLDATCQDWNAYYNTGHVASANTGTAARTDHLASPRISHEHLAFACLPPYLPVGKSQSGNFAGTSSIKARCLAGTHVGWHMLDWATSFIAAYRRAHTPFYVNAAFMEGHEGSGEVLRTLDARIAAFLRSSQPADAPFAPSAIDFNATAVLLVADHGALMGLNYAFLANGRVEAANPFAAMLLPRWYMGGGAAGAGAGNHVRTRDARLREAEQKLITAFDLYETVSGFMGNSSKHEMDRASRRGVDLLRQETGPRWSCENVGVDEDLCNCL